jgi:hypothetical protein
MTSEILSSAFAVGLGFGVILLVGCSAEGPGRSVGRLNETADAVSGGRPDGQLPGANDAGNLCGGVACPAGEHFDVPACRCVADTSPDSATQSGRPGGQLPGANDAGNLCGGVACPAGEHLDVPACRCLPDAPAMAVSRAYTRNRGGGISASSAGQLASAGAGVTASPKPTVAAAITQRN